MKYKHPSFYIFKFDSDRIHEYNYNINQTFSDGQRNGEIIRMADSQVLRSLRKIKGIEFSQERIYNLIKNKQILLKETSSDENKLKLKNVQDEIEKELFIPELVSICFKNKQHYDHIYKKGLLINKKPFVRLFSGSGNIRRNTVIFIDKDYYDKLDLLLSNGRDKSVPMLGSKLNAYYGMFGSSSSEIDFPKFVVVPDYKFEKTFLADKVIGFSENIEIKRDVVTNTINAFDGMGVISPIFMQKIANKMNLDYCPSWVIIRGPYMKGCVATFDINEFSEKIVKKNIVIDVWGNKQDISEIDIIFSESQFKLWNSYPNCEDYISQCLKNDLNFGVTRISPNPKEEKNHVFSNYQFNQVLSLDDKQIEGFCKPTIDYFQDILSGDSDKMAIYLSGYKKDEKKSFVDWFDTVQNNICKSLIINPNVKDDDFVYNYFLRFFNKTLRNSYLGRTVHNGNFQGMLVDLYAFCEHSFGLEVKGLLEEGKSYSNYWNKRNVKTVLSARAPLTHYSETNQLHFEKNENLQHWFKFIGTGIILAHDSILTYLYADSDFDGDQVYTTSQKEFIEGNQSDGVPIVYDKENAPKVVVDKDIIFKADLSSMNSEIGQITNISSTFHCMISDYENGSLENKELQKRLTALRAYQGKAIDKSKGLITEPMPENWNSYKKQNYSLSEDEQEKIRFMNKLTSKKRPLFFKFLYSHYQRRRDREIENMNDFCLVNFECSYSELIEKEVKSDIEMKALENFKNKSFFINNNSVMNRISRYLQSEVKEIKFSSRNKTFDYSIYITGKNTNPVKIAKMLELYKEYCSSKKAVKQNKFLDKESFSNIDQLSSYLRKKAIFEIDSNIQNLANIAVEICYNQGKIKEFAWDLFGNGIILNLLENKKDDLEYLISDNDGEIEYLWKKYSKQKFIIEDEKEENETLY